MANGSIDETVLWIGPPAPPPTPGRGGRYFAEASLVLSVMGLACVFLFARFQESPELLLGALGCALLALGFGVIGRRRGGESKVVGNCAILLVSLGVILVCLIPSSGGARSLARRAQFTNNMQQVGLALHNYQARYGRLPPAVVRDREGRPLYSWRVLILPYMEAGNLYEDFHLDERWDSPHNSMLLAKGPFSYSGIGVDGGRVKTYIQAFVGPGSAFENPEGEPFNKPDGSSNFPDGLGNTILAVEAREPVPWSAPFDLPFGTEVPLVALGGGYLRDRGLLESQPKVKDFVALFADGSAKTKPWPVAPHDLNAWVTRNGGEKLPTEP